MSITYPCGRSPAVECEVLGCVGGVCKQEDEEQRVGWRLLDYFPRASATVSGGGGSALGGESGQGRARES